MFQMYMRTFMYHFTKPEDQITHSKLSKLVSQQQINKC